MSLPTLPRKVLLHVPGKEPAEAEIVTEGWRGCSECGCIRHLGSIVFGTQRMQDVPHADHKQKNKPFWTEPANA